MKEGKIIRIGGASGFWGDSEFATPQLLATGGVDYLIYDYLAEVTMSLLARAKAKSPDQGYAVDFVANTLRHNLRGIVDQGVRVVSNAGGINPAACADAIRALAEEMGLSIRVAVVEGDDLTARTKEFRSEGVTEMFSGDPFPDDVMSVNAYLGAFPIARALDDGAQLVLTGRVVDSALVLGPLIHEFGWRPDDYDRLAQGSLAGHIIECGAQTTGGNYTDWETVADGYEDMGFPIAECAADGDFLITKPKDTGGRVTPATVGEQILYEIGDPQSYRLPDVTCDFTNVQLEEVGEDRVRITGAAGRPPGADYKVSATYLDGYRVMTSFMIGGIDAASKARRVGEAVLDRTRRLFRERNWGDYTEISLEALGAEDTYGPHARTRDTREAILKLGARHPSKDALELLSREIAPAALAMAPGMTGFFAGRPRVQPVVRLYSFLIDKARVPVIVQTNGQTTEIAVSATQEAEETVPARPEAPSLDLDAEDTVRVPLIEIAHARSGDKGNNSNIGVIARQPEFLAAINANLTETAVAEYFAHILEGGVERYQLPGMNAVNLVLNGSLGGGGMGSLRMDPQGKAHAQMLLDLPVRVPAAWVETYGLAPLP